MRRLAMNIYRLRALLALLLAAAMAAGLLALWPDSADAQTTFTVNRTGDGKDRKIGDGKCDASRKRGQQCTLRAAIQEANATPGADTINFAIGGTASVKTISPASPLPAITDPVTIDGYSQPGASPNTKAQGDDAVIKIQLNGANKVYSGFQITAADSTIKGLAINRFGVGIVVGGEGGAGASGNHIEGNFLGTNATGTQGLANWSEGVDISGGPNNTIGGTEPAERNVISGNGNTGGFGIGIVLRSSDTKVEGNYIGTKADGIGALGNFGDGVWLIGPNNTLGGTASGSRNIVSGNRDDGVVINGAANSKVEGNYIGSKADGTGALGNGWRGVFILGPAPNNNTIGGTTAGAPNQISNNGFEGILVGSGTGNSILSNAISDNGSLGIDLGGNGVTANDTKDPDSGANRLQNFPFITSAIRDSTTGVSTISGTLNSTPSQNFTIQCFVTEAGGDPSNHGEGKTLLDTTTTTTDANGDSPTFTCRSDIPAVGDKLSMTATNTATGDTSEFSLNQTVSSGP